MMKLMNQITDKPDWNIKVFDDNIANRWKNEALDVEDVDITQGMVDWCIEELRYKTKAFEKTGMVTAYNGDVVKSDVAVSSSLRLALIDAVKHLEDVPASERDWHPGSDEKVLDLVHPSLFPLLSGLTRVLPNGTTTLEDCIGRTGEGIALYFDIDWWTDSDIMPNPFSEKFQWLPCEVNLSGDAPKITSYINNLHPHQHKDLYCIIEKIIGCAIPLWNESLTRQKTPGYRFLRFEYHVAEREGDEEPEPKRGPDEDVYAYCERLDQWGEEDLNRKASQPEVKPFQPPNRDLFEEDGINLKPEHRVDLKRDYDRIQVIVKLANIHLTPEKPKYEGGTWHVEGQLNEHICASALLYYSSDNITPSRLAFRHMAKSGEYRDPRDADSINYMQGYHRWLEDVFGCQDQGPAIQDIGDVLTKEGRLITFPNILQHQVQPFELADPTKPGHRKILALFLVDPSVNIVSTANVPCQRKDWWRRAIKEQETLLGKLPLELKDNVYEMVEDFPISMEKAKQVRLGLMDERKEFVVKQNDCFNYTIFSLCEH
ncbi:Protein of unknown function (DUF4246) domain containing protein [Amanita muscaria]